MPFHSLHRHSIKPLRILLLLCFLSSFHASVIARSLTLGDYYVTDGSLSWGSYFEVKPGPNGQPLVLRLKGRSTDCSLKYHYRTEQPPPDVQQSNPSMPGGYIPVLGVTAPKDPKMFLLRLLYSIDYPVHDIVVITGGDDPGLAQEMQHVRENLANITHIHCNKMQSVTQGWNQIMTTYMDAPWMLLTAIDVQYNPGSLARFADRFWAEMPLGLEMAHVTYPNLKLGDYNQKFNAFAVTRKLVNRLGLPDENIWPAYCEDEEWMVRSELSGMKLQATTFLSVSAYHGRRNEDSQHRSGISHFGKLGELASRRHLRNCMYLKMKWGCTVHYRGACKYRTPFNLTNKLLSYWRFNTPPFVAPMKGNPLKHGLVTPAMLATMKD